MYRAVPYLTVSALVILFSFGAKQVDTSPNSPLLPIVGSWNSECGPGKCDAEETLENWEEYSEECMQASCSSEELSEIAGGTAAITPMLVTYLAFSQAATPDRLVVMQSSFEDNPSPPPGAVWWYTGCPSTGVQPSGKVIQTNVNSPLMPKVATSRNVSSNRTYVDFATSTAAFTMGANLKAVTLYTLPNYAGNVYPSPVSIACLSRTTPPLGNNVKSAKLTAATAQPKP